MNDAFEPRPTVYIPKDMLPTDTGSRCVLELTLRDGRFSKVCVDMKGMIYGVLVEEAIDSRINPIDFASEDVVSARVVNSEIPRGYKIV